MTTETLKNPNIPVLPNPVGLDAAIQQLQQSLASLEWLEKSFGRSFTMHRQIGTEKRLEPMVYQGSSEYYPVLPNDSLKSYSFFRVIGQREALDWVAQVGGNVFFFKDPVDLIFWVNLKAIDPSKNYIFKEELIQDVLRLLNRDSNVQVLRVWDDKVEDIFKGYTLQPIHRDNLYHPFAAFRFELTLNYQFTC